jgi:hypothetical protein
MDISIDLETFGTKATSVISNIGAVVFGRDGTLLDAFESPLNIQDQLHHGRDVSESTLKWWFKQTDEARAKIYDTPVFADGHNVVILNAFSDFCRNARDMDGTLNLWGNGSDFDNAMLGNLFDMYKIDRPWAHYENRCYRTIKALANNKYFAANGRDYAWMKPSLAHDALSDAKSQAVNAAIAMQILNDTPN